MGDERVGDLRHVVRRVLAVRVGSDDAHVRRFHDLADAGLESRALAAVDLVREHGRLAGKIAENIGIGRAAAVVNDDDAMKALGD